MITVFMILLCFLGVGLFTRKYSIWTRLILLSIIVGVLIYLTLA